MSTRTFLTSSFRSLPSRNPPCRHRTFISPTLPSLAPLADPADAHGSAPSTRKLRPRDRLQFTETSGRDSSIPGVDEALETSEALLAPLPDSTIAPDASSSPFSPSFLDPDPSSSSSSSNSQPSSPDGTDLVLPSPSAGFPPIPTHYISVPRIPFSTHSFVRSLENASVPRGMAEELMRTTKELLIREEERARADLLSRQDVENVRFLLSPLLLPAASDASTRLQEAYLFTAALNELKTGSQVKSRNDSITLRSLTATLQREVDTVDQKFKEDMQRLSSDIQVPPFFPFSLFPLPISCSY